jgi:hypothetical protein
VNKKKIFLFVTVIILLVIAGLLYLMRDEYSTKNPPDESYFESKYTSLDDAQKCIEEWHKYYPPINGLEQTVTGIPCPGQAR